VDACGVSRAGSAQKGLDFPDLRKLEAGMSCELGEWIFQVRNCWSGIINREWTEVCTHGARHSSLVYVEDAFFAVEKNNEAEVFRSYFSGLQITQGFNGSNTRRLVNTKRPPLPERIDKLMFGVCSWGLKRDEFYHLTGYLLENTDLIDSGDPRVNFLICFGIKPKGYLEFLIPEGR